MVQLLIRRYCTDCTSKCTITCLIHFWRFSTLPHRYFISSWFSSTWFSVNWNVHFECTSSYISDTGIGCGALPLDDIKFGPFFTFPAAAVDNYTRAPIEPAVKSVSWLELANWVTLTMVCLPSPSTCLHKIPFTAGQRSDVCESQQSKRQGCLVRKQAPSHVVHSVRQIQPCSPALIQPDTWAVVKILAECLYLQGWCCVWKETVLCGIRGMSLYFISMYAWCSKPGISISRQVKKAA